MKHPSVYFCSLAILAMVSGTASAQQLPPIKIGVSEALSGVNAYYGQQSRQAIELALNQVNAAGGINGRKIVADYQDNICNPAEGVKGFSQMLSSKDYIALVGGGCSSVTLAAMPLIKRAEIPMIVSTPSASAISEGSGTSRNEWTFKVNPSDNTMLVSLVDWLVKQKQADSISVIAEDTDFGRGGADSLKKILADSGKTIKSVDYFAKGTTDFTNVLTRIKSSKPSQLAVFAIGSDTADFLNQYAEVGGAPLTGRIQLEQIPPKIAGSNVFKGLSTVQPWDMAIDTPENKKFIADFKALAGADPTVNAWDSYEAARVVIAAIKAAGDNPTPAKVREALVTIKVPAMFGGMIEFDDHHLAHTNAVILSIQDGKTVVLGMSKT